MYRLVFVAMALSMALASMEANWISFKNKYKKNYTEKDDKLRENIWRLNLKTIEEHNELYEKGLKSYFLKANQYSDMTSLEFNSMMNGIKFDKELNPGQFVSGKLKAAQSASVDWRKNGYVTDVKDQGPCLAGWAFSAAGSLEGQHYKASGRLDSLSASNLVDCSKNWGNHGCQGGSIQKAFQYIIDNKGINTEESYPFQPEEKNCAFKKTTVGATIQSYKEVTSGSEDALQETVATVGPVSAAIDASHASFHQYGGGMYDERDCSSNRLNHGVLVVGYGTDSSGSDYWIVKNSYGTSWGQEGYIWMSRNKDNQCGIATEASYPVV